MAEPALGLFFIGLPCIGANEINEIKEKIEEPDKRIMSSLLSLFLEQSYWSRSIRWCQITLKQDRRNIQSAIYLARDSDCSPRTVRATCQHAVQLRARYCTGKCFPLHGVCQVQERGPVGRKDAWSSQQVSHVWPRKKICHNSWPLQVLTMGRHYYATALIVLDRYWKHVMLCTKNSVELLWQPLMWRSVAILYAGVWARSRQILLIAC